jgi:hypothetical protein
MAHNLDYLEVLITPERLAYLLGVQVETLAMWRRRGTGPEWYRIGRQIRYSEAAAVEWLQAQAAQVGDQLEPSAATTKASAMEA